MELTYRQECELRLAREVAKIALRMQDRNDHTMMQFVIAQAFGTSELCDEFAAIDAEWDKIGHLTSELGERRRDASIMLSAIIRHRYPHCVDAFAHCLSGPRPGDEWPADEAVEVALAA